MEPIIYWVRRDLRLADNPALSASCVAGGPVIPVFVWDEVVRTHGAAPKWRLGLSVETFANSLEEKGARLIIRKGKALDVLRELIAETGAKEIHWNRLYDPASRKRDEAVKSALKADGIEAVSHRGHLLFEPWSAETKTGGYFRVYSPFWRAVSSRDPGPILPEPALPLPEVWPSSMPLDELANENGMNRGADIVAPHLAVGEEAAKARLESFVAERIDRYKEDRNDLALNATSLLSENLTYGEISARQCWWAGQRARELGQAGAEHFLKELVWREFSYHLIYHTPQIVRENWRPAWDSFPWSTAPDTPEVTAWKRGMTGMPVIDAAMREMYVTGRMHNRARMLVASYLTKHLMVHWKLGLEWFEDCLVDWDPAANAMGWQWTAGSGPDAAPYFRIFNPESQAEKFDASGRYRRRWLNEAGPPPSATALSYFDAIPRAWGLSPQTPYPRQAIVTAAEGRARALAAYESR